MITYRQVKLADTQTVIESFLAEQWEHTGDKHLKCEPNWPMYHALDKVGSLLLLLAYDDDRPIGYLAGMIHPHVNSVHNLVGSIQTYFVEDRPGRAVVMKGLFEQAISLLKQRGVVRIMSNTNLEHSAARLLEKMGFQASDIVYKMVPTYGGP